MSERALKRILESIANEAIPPEEVDFWPAISVKLEARALRPSRRRPWINARIAVPVLLAIGFLAVSLLLVGPERALAALRTLVGYIPGIGFVMDETDGIRVLAEPVSLERDGVSITIEQGVVDHEHTVITYRVEGIPAEAYTRSEDDPGCTSLPALRLPDGTVLGMGRGQERGWGSGYQSRATFGPVPADVEMAAFLLKCLDGTRPGGAPENWELPLRFVAAPPDFAIAPVLDTEPTPEPTGNGQRTGEMGLYLENVVDLEDSFILVGEFRKGSELSDAIVHGVSEYPEIRDARGRILPFETPSDLDLVSTEMGVFPWAFQIAKGFASPLTITFPAVDVEYLVDANFEFDAGANPEPGQTWALDQSIEVAGHEIRLLKAVRLDQGYEFHFESDPSVISISASDLDHQPLGGSAGGYLGEFSVAFEYAEPIPSGILVYRVRGLIARYEGPWTLTWKSPEGAEAVEDLSIPQACLKLEGWRRISVNPAKVPSTLDGKLIIYGQIKDDGGRLSPENAGVFVVDLSSGERQILGPGTWPSLSSDGAKAAYSSTGGLLIHDLTTGESRLVAGTSESDYNPRWSPDGAEIAFVRSDDFNLYVMAADGSNLRRATGGREYEQLIGWMPNGRTLVYAFMGTADEMQLQFLDLASGDVQEGFAIDKGKALDAAISPDGQRISYTARVPGKMGYGLFLSNIDGSSPRLLVQLDHWGVGAPAWSPDGDWLMVNIIDNDLPDPGLGLALISPDSCAAIPLDGFEGHLFGWSR